MTEHHSLKLDVSTENSLRSSTHWCHSLIRNCWHGHLNKTLKLIIKTKKTSPQQATNLKCLVSRVINNIACGHKFLFFSSVVASHAWNEFSKVLDSLVLSSISRLFKFPRPARNSIKHTDTRRGEIPGAIISPNNYIRLHLVYWLSNDWVWNLPVGLSV